MSERLALLVGINAYADDPLDGCVNDAMDMAAYIRRAHGFRDDEIQLLLDAAASREAILGGLRKLVGGATSASRILFFYSGHGARATRAGVSVLDLLCPVEFDWEARANGIDALELGGIFAGLPVGCVFNWVADCCYSGNLAFDPGRPRRKRKFKPPPPVEVDRLVDALSRPSPRLFTVASALPFGGGFVSACKANEEAEDDFFDGRPNGAFTHFFLRELVAAPASTLEELGEGVRKALRSRNYDQTPRVRGSPAVTGLPFLGPPPGPRLAASALDAARSLAAGIARGLPERRVGD